MIRHSMHRREFIRNGSAALAFATLSNSGLNIFNTAPTRRVALIGTGWYGKSDLFRLMQVAPVDVVALCDVDKHLLNQAADMVVQRQSKKRSHSYMATIGNCYQNKNQILYSSAHRITGMHCKLLML